MILPTQPVSSAASPVSRHAPRTIQLALAIAGLVACGPTSTGTTDLAIGPTPEQACAAQAQASCSRLDACRKDGVRLRFGDLPTCVTRLTAGCLNALAAAHSGNTASQVQSCADATGVARCADYLAGNVEACQPKAGGIAQGSPCAFSGQCASAFCSIPLGHACGSCAPPANLGDMCTENLQCGRAMYCTARPGQPGTCASFGAQGVACSTSVDCQSGLGCVGAVNGAAGICQPAIAAGMASCDYKMGPPCDFDQGLFCSAPSMSTAGKCLAITTAAAGQACGVTFPKEGSMDALCLAGAVCYGAAKGMPGTCKAAASDGAACDVLAGPPCLPPARCATSGGTSGKCTLPDGAACL